MEIALRYGIPACLLFCAFFTKQFLRIKDRDVKVLFLLLILLSLTQDYVRNFSFLFCLYLAAHLDSPSPKNLERCTDNEYKEGGRLMDIIATSKSSLDALYTVFDIPLTFRAVFLSLKYGKEASKIKQRKGEYAGQRCFILGNGPSLKSVDFGRLQDKNLITVNMLYKYPAFDHLSPLFHCALDPGFYQGEYLESLYSILDSRPGTSLLVSSNAPSELRSRDNCYTTIFGYLPSRAVHSFDLAKPSAAFVNVILFAIELALYLGFSEIVLLGCDLASLRCVERFIYMTLTRLRTEFRKSGKICWPYDCYHAA